jgi:putative spermidine/putrescine transport system permease protein
MLAVSFFKRVQGAFYTPGFVFENYARFLTPFFGGVLGFSLYLAALVAAICVAVGLPFAYQLTRLPRRLQVLWLVALLAILSLSEVIIGFAWSTLFSRTAGVTHIFVLLGLMSEPVSLSPSFWAVLTGMVYQAFPYTILVLYPSVARLDASLVITDQAIYQSNMPFAAAMAIFLVLVSLALVGLSLLIGRRGALA